MPSIGKKNSIRMKIIVHVLMGFGSTFHFFYHLHFDNRYEKRDPFRSSFAKIFSSRAVFLFTICYILADNFTKFSLDKKFMVKKLLKSIGHYIKRYGLADET